MLCSPSQNPFNQVSPRDKKYWVGIQQGQSYSGGEGASLALVGHPSSID